MRVFVRLGLILFLCGGALGACGESAAPGTEAAAGGLAAIDQIKIKTGADQAVLEIKPRAGDEIKLEFGGQVLKGKLHEISGKRKYEREDGTVVYEIKAREGGEGFELNKPDGTLLWKVKFKSDKLKISDNEEGTNPYELKDKGEKIKIYENESEIGAVKFYDEKTKVKNAANDELFEIKPASRSAAYGVLMLPRIGETERFVLVAELLLRGK